MVKTFKVGDHVSWNSEAGRVRGKIVKCISEPSIIKATFTVLRRMSRSMKSRATRPTTSPCTRPGC
jgi:Hypervirulence associated proteins TUDOR domain